MSHHESVAKGEDGRMVDRMVFFSDAVIAIVLTILVLELRPPPHEYEGPLLQGVLEQWRLLVSFALSFLLIGVYWVAHMRITRRLRVFDWPVAVCNLLFLFTITLVPFAAAVLGEHIEDPVAMQIYGAAIIAVSLSQALLWTAASRGRGRLIGGVTASEYWAGLLRGMGPGIVFMLVIALIAAGETEAARLAPLAIVPVMLATRFLLASKRNVRPDLDGGAETANR